MIDLFVVPHIPNRAVSYVHRVEPEPASKDVAHGRIRKDGPRTAEHRLYHMANRKKRLAQMRARYLAKKAEYVARTKKWRKDNRLRYNEIQRESAGRLRRKRKLAPE